MKTYTLLLAILAILPALHAVPVQNIAKNKPVTGSPIVQENPFTNINDGNDDTVWYFHTASATEHVEIDLQGTYKIDRILLRGFNGEEKIRILVKTASDWKEVFFKKIKKVGANQDPFVGFEPTDATKVRIEYTTIKRKQYVDKVAGINEIEIYTYEPQPVFVNQSGYNINQTKRLTAPLAPDGTPFQITAENGNSTLFSGKIKNNIGDFTAFNPASPGPYVATVVGNSTGTSFPFEIAPALIERSTYLPLVQFMVDTRSWYGNSTLFAPTDKDPGVYYAGIGWRDSHQFSFEIPSLLNLYFSNPAAFSAERMPPEAVYSGMTEELPANTPEILHLVYWAVDIYVRGEANHTFIKEQLAHFLYAYPLIQDYIPRKTYERARDYLFAEWTNPDKTRWNWHDIDHTANLLQTYTIIGTGKGEFPPGHSIVPNLMMYEVAKREKRSDADRYLDAAIKQTKWLIENLDWNDPVTTRGQRMSEHLTIPSFTYFLENYPDKAPAGLREKITEWAKVAISRSDNLWDLRKYSDTRWGIPDIRPKDHERYDSENSFNESGNIAGFPASALAAAAVIDDPAIQSRLREISTAHIDHVFGRNPAGRHFCYDYRDFPGAKLGWFQEYRGGAGFLQTARGVLDGNPKERLYPYNPYGGDPGHTEGWIAFNTSFIDGLAFLSADETKIEIIDGSSTITVRLTAPLNFDSLKTETVQVSLNDGSSTRPLTLTELTPNNSTFTATIDKKSLNLKPNTTLTVTYGLARFQKSASLTLK